MLRRKFNVGEKVYYAGFSNARSYIEELTIIGVHHWDDAPDATFGEVLYKLQHIDGKSSKFGDDLFETLPEAMAYVDASLKGFTNDIRVYTGEGANAQCAYHNWEELKKLL